MHGDVERNVSSAAQQGIKPHIFLLLSQNLQLLELADVDCSERLRRKSAQPKPGPTGRACSKTMWADSHIQVLLNHVRAACDAIVATARGLSSPPEGTLRAAVDEVEGRPARADPWFALLVGKNVCRRVKRCLLRPTAVKAIVRPTRSRYRAIARGFGTSQDDP